VRSKVLWFTVQIAKPVVAMWEGEINNFTKHVDDCQFVDMDCPSGCDAKLKRQCVQDHLVPATANIATLQATVTGLPQGTKNIVICILYPVLIDVS